MTMPLSLQIARLKECERILVALELSNFLNDSSYALQAVTQCYGLLAPIIYHSIALVPVVQVRSSSIANKGLFCFLNKGSSVILFRKKSCASLVKNKVGQEYVL